MTIRAAICSVWVMSAAVAAYGGDETRPAGTQAAEKELLVKWLEGKSEVKVTFVGPEMDLGALRKAGEQAAMLPAEVEEAAKAKAAGKGYRVKWEGFVLVPGERGDQYYLRVEMKVTEENVKRLGLMVERMAASGYAVDVKQNKVVEEKGAATRE